ncbi:hypothetical protein TNIN_373401 [Trichonephila inaurata madagascariensis]|uniref:Uncharacterized protein n=1 Tax=Trichonephila inaurata madagascariensis TaxID=2747483 RepID=A0A8X6XT79_9ARAC|nr:hypothetical protein TNIN_373401 [Trichonephila inaurata madagascariensis]
MGKDNSNLEYPPQRKNARKLILDLPTFQQISIFTNKIALPQNANVNNIGNAGNVAQEKNPPDLRTTGMDSGARTSANQNTAQNQIPPPIMLLVPDNCRSKRAAITKEFPKRRSRLTGDFLRLYADSHNEKESPDPHNRMDSGARTSTNQNTAQNQLPPPIMLLVPDNYRSQRAAFTKEFPKCRSA